MLDSPPAVVSGGLHVPPSPADATVRLEGVTFAYPARPALVLDGFDLVLRPGEIVALVGPSGAGKSTVANVLLRLVQPTAGRVTVDGVDLAECDVRAWRSNLAWVPQRPAIVRGTIAENIRLGCPAATGGEVRDAASLAGADAFVRSLPDGYETVIGDGGRALSAGERRRLALARAFVRAAPLVILDEPTADLDPSSSDVVEEAIMRFPPGTSVLLIAHRPELVRHADRVVGLRAGRAVEPAASVVA